MSRGQVVQYRTAGYYGVRSILFLKQIEADGEDPEVIETFKNGLALFESLALFEDFDEAMEAFTKPVPANYQTFLEGLHRHVRATARSERVESLHYIALNGNFRESVKAMELLGDFRSAKKQ